VEPDLQMGLAMLISRLEAIREELAAHTIAMLTRDAAHEGVVAQDLHKRVANRYLDHVKRATELHKSKPSTKAIPPVIHRRKP